MFRLLTLSLLVMVVAVLAEPTMYKKNEQNIYEPGEGFGEIGDDVIVSILRFARVIAHAAASISIEMMSLNGRLGFHSKISFPCHQP
jgi:hypothetical protein